DGGRGAELADALRLLEELGVRRSLALARRRLPGHVEDMRLRAHVLLRIAVAFEAPAHAQVRVFARDRHLVHASVAAHAADSLLEMDAVIEIDEVREIVNALPLDRPPRAIALPHRLQQRALGP